MSVFNPTTFPQIFYFDVAQSSVALGVSFKFFLNVLDYFPYDFNSKENLI
jgi:hypothetical protein